MATHNIINQASNPLSSTAITIDPAASADSYVQYNISTAAKFRDGVDQSDSDAYKISQGNALGTNDCMTVSSVGEILRPLQPAFLAGISADILNVTGDGTAYTIVFNTEVYDQNNDFNSTTGVFTAPVAGRYSFACTVLFAGLTSSHTSGTVYLVASNRTPLGAILSPAAQYNPGNSLGINFGVEVDMDAADTASIQVTISNGTKVADITTTSFFGGLLIC